MTSISTNGPFDSNERRKMFTSWGDESLSNIGKPPKPKSFFRGWGEVRPHINSSPKRRDSELKGNHANVDRKEEGAPFPTRPEGFVSSPKSLPHPQEVLFNQKVNAFESLVDNSFNNLISLRERILVEEASLEKSEGITKKDDVFPKAIESILGLPINDVLLSEERVGQLDVSVRLVGGLNGYLIAEAVDSSNIDGKIVLQEMVARGNSIYADKEEFIKLEKEIRYATACVVEEFTADESKERNVVIGALEDVGINVVSEISDIPTEGKLLGGFGFMSLYQLMNPIDDNTPVEPVVLGETVKEQYLRESGLGDKYSDIKLFAHAGADAFPIFAVPTLAV